MGYFALEIQEKIQEWNQEINFPFDIQIGIHFGPCVSGIIGKKKVYSPSSSSSSFF